MTTAMEAGANEAMPLVSVIVPTFNRSHYLRIALQSAVGQTYRNLEIIVQDNASTEDPADIVASFRDPRIAYWRNPVNIGLTANVVSACARAHGKYIAILGDDDVWHPDFIATLIRPLEADESLAIAFCDHEAIHPDGSLDSRWTEELTRRYQRRRLQEGAHRPFDEIALVYRSICLFSAALLRRGDIDWRSVPLDISYGLDVYLAYLAARTRKGCYYVSARLAQYRFHPTSAGSGLRQIDRKITNARDAVTYWTAFRQDEALRPYWRYFEMKRGLNALVIVLALLRGGRREEAWHELQHSWVAGLIRPRIVVYHFLYALKLHRTTA